MATAEDYAAWIVKNADKKGAPEFDIVAKAYQQAKGAANQLEEDRKKYSPTEGMSAFERGAAGFGKAIVDTGRGLGQFVGLVDRADIEESRKLDAALKDTTAGSVGNFLGNVATTLPLAFVPGANTVRGAALIGSAAGLAQPSTSTSETLQNAGLGAAAGGGSILAGRGLAAGYQAATGFLRPFTRSGQQQIAAELLQSSATNPQAAAQRLAQARELVRGSSPTVGQASGDAGLAQLERTLLNRPETAGPLNMRYQAQQEARQRAVGEIASTPEYRDLIRQGRDVFANEDYARAIREGINPEMARALQPQIDSLMRRPSMRQAQQVARRLAAENDIALNDFGSLEGMDWLKKALDNQISRATQPGSSVGKAELRALMQTKDDLMNTLEQIAPAYRAANDNFAAMSNQVNSMDVAADLQRKLFKNAQFGGNKESAAAYQNALQNSMESIRAQTGQNRALSEVMPERDLNTLEAVARDLVRKETGQNLGRAVGSPTMQNMLGQNLLQRIAGPMGAPQSLAQNALMQTLSRPYGFAARAAEPAVNDILSEAITSPELARLLLTQAATPSTIGRVANNLERFVPVPALTANRE